MTCWGRHGLHCPYCDLDGKNYIEVSDKGVVEYLKSIEKDRLEEILKGIDKKEE